MTHWVLAHWTCGGAWVSLLLAHVENALGLQARSLFVFLWAEGECLVREEKSGVAMV